MVLRDLSVRMSGQEYTYPESRQTWMCGLQPRPSMFDSNKYFNDEEKACLLLDDCAKGYSELKQTVCGDNE